MQFAKWNASGPSAHIGAAAVDKLAGDDSATLREDGVWDAESRSYEAGGRAIHVTLYRLRDSSGAYAAFTALRSPDMAQTDIATFSAVNRTRALLVTGSQVMDVRDLEGASPADLRALVAAVSTRADKAPYPTLGSYLPVSGRVANSEKYLLGPAGFRSAMEGIAAGAPNSLLSSSLRGSMAGGDWIGFDGGAEAAIARYHSSSAESGTGESVLLLIEYPTYQIAAAKLRQIEAKFPQTGAAARRVFTRRKGSLVSVVFASNGTENANALLDKVRYQTQVTWNEPTHQFKEPSISVMIVEAFVGTGVILMFAVIAGLGFGGLRLITKYFLPGKVFDRREHVEILQLGISSKPIEGRDFY